MIIKQSDNPILLYNYLYANIDVHTHVYILREDHNTVDKDLELVKETKFVAYDCRPDHVTTDNLYYCGAVGQLFD